MDIMPEMGAHTLGWVFLAAVLFMSSFGVTWAFWIIIYIISFLVGVLLVVFYHGKEATEQWKERNKNLIMPPPSIGLPKIIQSLSQGKPVCKMDKRMTGSGVIDDVLQEVLEYVYRDYIHSWYRKISDDKQFKYDIQDTLQRVIITLSDRAKEVDLVNYLTITLVDEFASQIKLYRRSIMKVAEHKKDDTKPPPDLESIFFDLETEMEGNICRDMMCMSDASERQYLQDLCEVLLFLLVPTEDFHNKPCRYIVREVLVNAIFLPTINMLSDPDYLNQTISWLCKDSYFTNEFFLTIIKTSDSIEELEAVKEKVDVDIARQRSKDTGGEDDADIKQQLNSLVYVKNACENRISDLQKGIQEPEITLPGGIDINKLMVPGQKLYSLPFDVVLNNNVALSCFSEFMTNIGSQHYLLFYLNVEGYRVSAEQQISAALLSENGSDKNALDMLKEGAKSIYNQYLSKEANPQVVVEDSIVRHLQERIQNQPPSDRIFDEVQARVWDILQEDTRFFPAFKKSQIYIRLLAELDLLRDVQDRESVRPDDEVSSRGSSKPDSLQASAEDLTSSCDSSIAFVEPTQRQLQNFTLAAEITNTGICREHGKSYAIYLITVTKTKDDGSEDKWDVYRRYSDFHDLHMIITDRYESLSGLVLPSKKTFANMDTKFLEKRKSGLNAYLQAILSPAVLNNHPMLLDLVYKFLEHYVWEKEKSELARKMDTVVKPLKTVGSFVKSMPDNFVDGVAKMSGGIKSIPNNMLDGMGKILNVKGSNLHNMLSHIIALSSESPQRINPAIKADMTDGSKVGASLDNYREEDNIPLRIMILLMDEVFDLKNNSNPWFQRRLVAILRQLIKTMFGDSINRKIVEHVEWMTSAEQIAQYITSFKDSFWPNGVLAEPKPSRDHNTKMRTRVVAKSKMLGTVSDDVKQYLGSEITRQGVMRVFNMFQYPKLNKRLVYVILEGLLVTMFPENNFQDVFTKIHSRSPRVKKDIRSDKVPEPDVRSRKK